MRPQSPLSLGAAMIPIASLGIILMLASVGLLIARAHRMKGGA
jgi:hypothetical protein